MLKLKQWFKSLEKREQWMVSVAVIALLFYLVYGVMYRGLVDSRDKLVKQNVERQSTLEWMRGAVQTINSLHHGSAVPDVEGKSLAQLAEDAGRDAGVKISRFQPSSDTEAQVWLERESFNNVLAYLNRLETDYGLQLLDVSITSANSPGIVNLRLKFGR